MEMGYRTPLQLHRIAVASVTGDATKGLADLMVATAAKRWTTVSNDNLDWERTFGSPFPLIKNCLIKIAGTTGYTVCKDGSTYEVAANVEETYVVQDLNELVIGATAVKVLIQY